MILNQTTKVSVKLYNKKDNVFSSQSIGAEVSLNLNQIYIDDI